MIYTSLAEIKSFNPCASGWRDILTGQRKTSADAILFHLTDALESNSISDICWLLGKRKKEIQVCVEFARQCAESVKELNNYYSRQAATAANAAANAANAAYAAAAAANAANYAVAAADAYAAYAYAAAYADADAYAAAQQKQVELNKSFLHKLITDWEGDATR